MKSRTTITIEFESDDYKTVELENKLIEFVDELKRNSYNDDRIHIDIDDSEPIISDMIRNPNY
jgi:uncharacterized protein (DUF1499 family)